MKSLRALRKCAEFLAFCLRIGWQKSQLDVLEEMWWQVRDEKTGEVKRGQARLTERGGIEMKFRQKPVVIEAITFDELVEYGRTHGGNIVNGMPWSFTYAGQPITHENDNCYLIGTMRFDRGDMLITLNGATYPCKSDLFAATYDKEE